MTDLAIDQAFALITVLVGLSTAIQSAEFLKLRSSYWPWSIVRRDYLFLPKAIIKLLDLALVEKNFLILNVARLGASLMLIVFPHFSIALFLFLSTVLIVLRYRGSFNGGSDFMTLIVLLATTIALAFPHPAVLFVCLWYIAIQSCSSYFIGGFVKLRKRNWRNGKALTGFMGSTIYKESPITGWLKSHAGLALIMSWVAMSFEVAFPFLAFTPMLVIPTLAIGAVFHFANAYLFGLNRFTFAWIATYPAIYFCQQSLSHSFS